MANAIEEWAMKRACELSGTYYVGLDLFRYPPSLQAFARYIAAHEQPPVDPLLIEARELVAKRYDKLDPRYGEAIRAGQHDYWTEVGTALSGLKRGMELAAKGGA